VIAEFFSGARRFAHRFKINIHQKQSEFHPILPSEMQTPRA
jgi:hypothetical protein